MSAEQTGSSETSPTKARIMELRQRPVTDDPAVSGNLADKWTLTVPPEMPPQPPDVDPIHGAFGLLRAVQFAPLVEVQLSPGATREVELQVDGPSVLLGMARWVGTSDRLDTSLSLEGSTVATGTSHSCADKRGGSILRARVAGGGRAMLGVTNTSDATVTVRIVFGALDSLLESGDTYG